MYVLPYGQMSFWGVEECPIYLYFINTSNYNESMVHLDKFVLAIIINTPRSRTKKGSYKITSEVISVLFGSLLGDASAEKRTNKGTRISFGQEHHNKEHLLQLWKILSKNGICSLNEPGAQKRKGTESYSRQVYRFKTYTFQEFDFIYDSFYTKNNIKVPKMVPSNIMDYLTAQGLAIWIMDDGTWQGSGVRIATNCFTKEEQEFLCQVLKEKFNLKATIVRSGTSKSTNAQHYNIYIHKESIPLLRELVKPYFVKSMLYKIGLS